MTDETVAYQRVHERTWRHHVEGAQLRERLVTYCETHECVNVYAFVDDLIDIVNTSTTIHPSIPDVLPPSAVR